MFSTVASTVLGILGIAAAADWLSWHKRTVTALRARAELAQTLPACDGRRTLENHLDEAVAQFVADIAMRRRLRAPVLILALLVSGLVLSLGAFVWSTLSDHTPWWLSAVTWVGILMELLGVVLLRNLGRKLNAPTDQPSEAVTR